MSARGRGRGGAGGEKRKQVNLCVAQKLELIKKLESGVSVSMVCEEYGVKKQTVSDIRKAKDKLLKFAREFDVSGSGGGVCKAKANVRKHMKVAKDEDLEKAVYKWFVQQQTVHMTVRGVELASAAEKLAADLGIVNFKGQL